MQQSGTEHGQTGRTDQTWRARQDQLFIHNGLAHDVGIALTAVGLWPAESDIAGLIQPALPVLGTLNTLRIVGRQVAQGFVFFRNVGFEPGPHRFPKRLVLFGICQVHGVSPFNA